MTRETRTVQDYLSYPFAIIYAGLLNPGQKIRYKVWRGIIRDDIVSICQETLSIRGVLKT